MKRIFELMIIAGLGFSLIFNQGCSKKDKKTYDVQAGQKQELNQEELENQRQEKEKKLIHSYVDQVVNAYNSDDCEAIVNSQYDYIFGKNSSFIKEFTITQDERSAILLLESLIEKFKKNKGNIISYTLDDVLIMKKDKWICEVIKENNDLLKPILDGMSLESVEKITMDEKKVNYFLSEDYRFYSGVVRLSFSRSEESKKTYFLINGKEVKSINFIYPFILMSGINM